MILNGIDADQSFPQTNPLPYRNTPKQTRLSKPEIIKILQGIVLEAPLIDYIVAHGVITLEAAQDLMRCPDSGDGKIERLLDLLEGDNETPQQHSHDAKLVLLTNALRSTGQHTLASQIDCGRKIKPAPAVSIKKIHGLCDDISDIAASCDSNASPLRRRGQLRLWVQVSAVRVSPANYQQQQLLLLTPEGSPARADGSGGPRKWPRAASVGSPTSTTNGNGVQNLLETSHGVYFWIDLKSSVENPLIPSLPPATQSPEGFTPRPPKRSAISRFLSLCCCCVGKQRGHKALSSQATLSAVSKTPRPSVDYRLPSFILPFASPDEDATAAPTNGDIISKEETAERERQNARLRAAKLAILDAKSNEFYRGLAYPLSDAVVKYLEQSLGVLVLGAAVEARSPENCFPPGAIQALTSAASLSILATTSDALERLRATVTIPAVSMTSPIPPSSSLSTALENIVLRDTGFLEVMGVQDIRLSVGLEEDELMLAVSELEEE